MRSPVRRYGQERDIQLRTHLRTHHVLSEAREEPTKETKMKLVRDGRQTVFQSLQG